MVSNAEEVFIWWRHHWKLRANHERPYTQCNPTIYREISSAIINNVTSFGTLLTNHRWLKNLWLKYGYRKKRKKKTCHCTFWWPDTEKCYFFLPVMTMLTSPTCVEPPLEKFDHHDDVIKWKHFPRYWPFVRGIHRSPVNSPHKGQWRRALMFSMICALNKRLIKKREAGDLRRHRVHNDVTVMIRLWDMWK